MEHKTISQCQLQLLLQEELLDRYIRVLEIRRSLNLWRNRKILAIRIGHRKVHIPSWLIILQRRNPLYRLYVVRKFVITCLGISIFQICLIQEISAESLCKRYGGPPFPVIGILEDTCHILARYTTRQCSFSDFSYGIETIW